MDRDEIIALLKEVISFEIEVEYSYGEGSNLRYLVIKINGEQVDFVRID